MFLNAPIAHSVNLDAVMPRSYGRNYVRLDALVRILVARLHTSDQRSLSYSISGSVSMVAPYTV